MKKVLLTLVTIGLLMPCRAEERVPQKRHSENSKKEVASSSCKRTDRKAVNRENSALYSKVVAANLLFATHYKSQPLIFPQKQAAVLTCMDARILPNEIMGFKSGDMHVIRNAGGRADRSALRSLIISHKLLGTNQFFVIHHTDCALQKISNKGMNELIEESLAPANLIKDCNKTNPTNGNCKSCQTNKCQSNSVCKWENISTCCGKRARVDFQAIDWLPIEHCQIQSVIEDVETIRNHPLIPADIPIYGFIFDVVTGLLIPVYKADNAGKATPLFCEKCAKAKKIMKNTIKNPGKQIGKKETSPNELPAPKAKKQPIEEQPVKRIKKQSTLDLPVVKAKKQVVPDLSLVKTKKQIIPDMPVRKIKKQVAPDLPLVKTKKQVIPDMPVRKIKKQDVPDLPLVKAKKQVIPDMPVRKIKKQVAPDLPLVKTKKQIIPDMPVEKKKKQDAQNILEKVKKQKDLERLEQLDKLYRIDKAALKLDKVEKRDKKKNRDKDLLEIDSFARGTAKEKKNKESHKLFTQPRYSFPTNY